MLVYTGFRDSATGVTSDQNTVADFISSDDTGNAMASNQNNVASITGYGDIERL